MKKKPISPEVGYKTTQEEDKRACDTCRRRKVKCELINIKENGINTCESCLKRGEQCTFLEKPKPRGRRRKQPIPDHNGTIHQFIQTPVFDHLESLPSETIQDTPTISRESITLQDILDPPFEPSLCRPKDFEQLFNQPK